MTPADPDAATPRRGAPPHEYAHGEGAPCTDAYLAGLVVRLCREHGARRVLDVGCGNGTLCRRSPELRLRRDGARGLQPA